MTKQEIREWKDKIDAMDRIEMCRLWRFSPAGHPLFVDDSPIYQYFQAKFNSLGGFSPKISKAIGW